MNKRFRKIIFPLFSIALLSIIFSVSYSDFGVMEEEIVNVLTPDEETIKVTFDYNDGDFTSDYFLDVTAGYSIKEVDIPVTNSSINGEHEFVGWYTAKTGGEKVNFPLAFNETTTLYARYKNNKTNYQNGIDLVTREKPYYISSYNDITNSAVTLSNKTINALYGSTSDNVYNEDDYGTLYNIWKVEEAQTRLILNSDIVLNNSTLQLNCILGFKSGTYMNATISEQKFTVLDLNGYTITLQNNSNLNGYGIIYNSKSTGGIIAQGGSTITSPFCVYDFKGGGNTLDGSANTVSPFFIYLMPYLTVETIIEQDSYLKGVTSLNARNSKYTTVINLVGPSNSLITNKSGYFIRRATSYLEYSKEAKYISSINVNIKNLFDSKNFREEIILCKDAQKYLDNIQNSFASKTTGSFVLNSLELSVSGNTINMGTCDFTVPPFMDFSVYDSMLDFNISISCLPGSNIYFNENSTLNFKNGNYNNLVTFARLNVLDEFPFRHKLYDSSTKSLKDSGFYVYDNLSFFSSKAKVSILGNLTFDNSNIDKTTYCFYSLGGLINLSTSASQTLTANYNIIDASIRFYYPAWIYGNDKYCPTAAQYYSSPIIDDNNKAYFQKEPFTEINEGEYIASNHTTKFENKYYFKLIENQFSAYSDSSTGLMFGGYKPNSSNLKGKINCSKGTFVEAINISDNNKSLIYNGETYVFVYGIYIKVSNIDLNEENKTLKASYSNYNNGPFTPVSGSAYSCPINLEYNYSYGRWLFAL